MSEDIERKMLKLMEKYKVNDLNVDEASVIFVLESPHIEEIREGYPLAGSSGRAMTRVLFPSKKDFRYKCECKNQTYFQSLGKLIKDETITKIGIMNISQIPLQTAAYDCEDINVNCDLLKLFELIRKNTNKRTKKTSEINDILLKIMGNFKDRIQPHIKSDGKTIVLCGKFARTIFASTALDNRNIFKMDIPHPSFCHWDEMSEEQKNKLRKLVK